MEGLALECMQMGVGWGEWTCQVEHSSTEEQGCMWVCTSICARSAVRIAVRMRYGGVMVCRAVGLASGFSKNGNSFFALNLSTNAAPWPMAPLEAG